MLTTITTISPAPPSTLSRALPAFLVGSPSTRGTTRPPLTATKSCCTHLARPGCLLAGLQEPAIDLLGSRTTDGQTPWHKITEPDLHEHGMCGWLVKKGLLHLINESCEAGRTPLLHTTKHQRSHLVATWLLDHGATPDEVDSQGLTVFTAACKWARPDLVRLLADRVPRSHLEADPVLHQVHLHQPRPLHPMRVAYEHLNPHANEIARILILRCGTTRLENFCGPAGKRGRAAVLKWVERQVECTIATTIATAIVSRLRETSHTHTHTHAHTHTHTPTPRPSASC